MLYLWRTGVGMTGRKNESGAGKARAGMSSRMTDGRWMGMQL